MISLAAFDMAGTTINDGGAVYRALEDSVTETGVLVKPEDLQTWMGVEKREAITALIELGGGVADEDLVGATFARFRELLDEYYTAEPPTPIDGVPEAIAKLQAAGIKVALTTGFSRDVAEGILRGLGWTVGADGVSGSGAGSAGVAGGAGAGGSAGAVRVDALSCGDDVAAGRPAPFMIHRVMEATGVTDVAEVLVAGDTAVDVRAGLNSGAAISVGVLTGKLDRASLEAEGPTAVLDSVAAIPAYLGV
ncbi:phosphonatase-like hydrolase [Leucobacter komagatae]|uniref:Phosphonatase-like hydrolase n=1 Tax=Leucobacter komagatae TaxID=55969 RepID=A0A542Y791_9MICO|nr:HAD family hydrolase [Leucobacter komagatae]TQL43968.1 phosphonatase-like hydrolase [Leucobacter komagatae]